MLNLKGQAISSIKFFEKQNNEKMVYLYKGWVQALEDIKKFLGGVK